MSEEKRMAGDYEIVRAMHIGDKEVVFGIDDNNAEGMTYLCAYCKTNDIFRSYEDGMVSNDYLEIMSLFFDRLKSQIEGARAENDKITVPTELITPDQCYPHDYGESIENKIVAVKPSILRREYQSAVNQICLVTGGNGSHANANGRKVYNTNLYYGNQSYCLRQDILGVIKPEHMQDWMKERLAAIQSERGKPAKTIKPKDKER